MISITNCNAFVLELDDIYLDSVFKSTEDILLTDMPVLPIWSKRRLRLTKKLRKIMKGQYIGLMVTRRNEFDKLLTDVDHLSKYKPNLEDT